MMNTSKDIIGIVKELLDDIEDRHYLLSNSPQLSSMATEEERLHIKANLGARMMTQFPAIAQALLIACEALEKSNRLARPFAEPGIPDLTYAMLRELFLVSEEALASIHSLSA